jgi:hypothetical protein
MEGVSDETRDERLAAGVEAAALLGLWQARLVLVRWSGRRPKRGNLREGRIGQALRGGRMVARTT